jgi:hypothetical protein
MPSEVSTRGRAVTFPGDEVRESSGCEHLTLPRAKGKTGRARFFRGAPPLRRSGAAYFPLATINSEEWKGTEVSSFLA